MMGRCIVAGGNPDMAAPVAGILLSSIAEGSIVKLNENGSPVEFYVAKHDYESALNGAGRTLLLRKYCCYDVRAWHSSDVNAYASSDIDAWFNGPYKNMLSENAKIAIGETSFYYTPGNGNESVSRLKRSVFALSLTELGFSNSSVNVEGSILPNANLYAGAYYSDGNGTGQWTRSPKKGCTNLVVEVTNGNSFMFNNPSNTSFQVDRPRPCFTLPSNAVFDRNTLLFKGVA